MSILMIERMFAHMAWADGRLLSLLNAGPWDRLHPSMRLFSHLAVARITSTIPLVRIRPAMRLLSHLVASERVWLLRLRGEASGDQAIWPKLGPDALTSMAMANRAGYARYLETIGDDDLISEVHYTNQHGLTYRTQVQDILVHVAMHGSYHRGQIAASVRAARGEPVNTDYITYVRELGRELGGRGDDAAEPPGPEPFAAGERSNFGVRVERPRDPFASRVL